MHLKVFLLGSAGIFVGTSSLPVAHPQGVFALPYCEETYRNEAQYEYKESPKLVSGAAVTGCESGCNLGHTDDWSVSTTISAGGGFNLDFAEIGRGVNAQFQVSVTTKGQAVSENIGCPAEAKCMLQAENHMLRVEGQIERSNACDKPRNPPFEVGLPLLIKEGGKFPARVDYSCSLIQRPPKPVNGFDYPDCPPEE